jgi:hypothetical protein
LTENLLLGLLRALPCLELLILDWRFRLDGARLQDLARHCPRLAVLDLPQAQLCLSLALMAKTYPLWQLEIMRFARIYFKDPRRLMQWDKIRSIATEWRRVFPKLRGMPCSADVYSRYMEEDYLSEELEGDMTSVSVDEEMSLSEPGLDFDDYESDWFILRTKLWRVLGYRKDSFIYDRIQNIWQTNREIETIGWPVMPLAAFSDSDLHSTTAKCY